MPDDLRFETLDVHATDEASLQRLAAYADCFAQAFFSGRMSEEQRRHWLESARADGTRVRAVYDDAAVLRPAAAPVATYSSWGGRINVGAGRTSAVRMVSDVTVEPTHRRRGILRRLMTEDLAEAAADGVPLAALTASEATIYGRYGFAAATRERRVEVDTGTRFALRHPVEGLRVEVLDPEVAYEAVRTVDEATVASVRGAVAKPAFYAAWDDGSHDWDTDARDRRSRVAVAVDAAGSPVGYARFSPRDVEDRPGGTASVSQLAARDAASYLRLWDFVAHLDLVHTVSAAIRVDDLLDVALVDHRVVRTQKVRDHLWLRVLDPVAALEARPWRDDGSVVVGVRDPLGHADGRFRVVVRDTRARVERTDEAAEVEMGVETLSALHLGDRTVTDLAAAGRVDGPGTATFAAMADHAGPPPWNTTDF